MRRLIFILLISFYNLFLSANDSLDVLFAGLAQKDDLSEQTKKESSGYLKIYTRNDLDKMKIKSLKEIIDQIPLIRYRENRYGYSDPFYTPYQPSLSNGIKVFIDDRELIAPYNGNGLQVFAQMGLEFIDHIEIYMGIPSQSFGLSSSTITIKCYTKNPQREQVDVAGGMFGNRNSHREYAYSAKALNSTSYLLYVSNNQIKRKKIYYQENKLSRDRNIKNIYGKITKKRLTFDFHLAKAKMDNFMGKSFNIDPENPNVNVDYLYSGLYYKNKDSGFSSYINYIIDYSKVYDKSKTILGITPSYNIYRKLFSKMKEEVSNIKISKIFKTDKNRLILGLRSRLKKFNFQKTTLDNFTYSNNFGYNQEAIFSLYGENNFLVNKSNLLTTSFVLNKYNENSSVKNYNTLSGRIGYIYNVANFTSKSFIFYGENIPNMDVLYKNRAYYGQTDDPEKSKQMAISTKFIYKKNDYKTSLLLGHFITKNDIYFNGSRYDTTKNQNIIDVLSYRYSYNFNYLNRLDFNSWVSFENNKNLPTDRRKKSFGGYISFFNKFGKIDLYNNLVYRKWSTLSKTELNFNSTVTYSYNKDLTLYLKANNLFNKSITENYYSINPLSNTIKYLNNVQTIDRTVFIGLEYQF